jgi:aryl-alcohol dehydrogenase-like predicted oxidoreductase
MNHFDCNHFDFIGYSFLGSGVIARSEERTTKQYPYYSGDCFGEKRLAVTANQFFSLKESNMQPDPTRLLSKLQIKLPLIGVYDASEESLFHPLVELPEPFEACLFSFIDEWKSGKTLHLSEKSFGCRGCGYWMFGVANRPRPDFISFLVDTEGLRASHQLMHDWIDTHQPYRPKHGHLFIGPLKKAAYDYLKTLTFFVNPDQLSILIIGAHYHSAPGDAPPVIAPFGSGCSELLPLFENEEIPQAIIGGTDIAMRQWLPPDILTFTVTKPLLQRLCQLDEKSFLYKSFFDRLMSSRKAHPWKMDSDAERRTLMKHRQIGKTGFQAAEIGLGAWQLGGDWGEVADAEAMNILAAAVDNGVNFFDTADVYGAGRSESLIGNFLKNRREKVFVTTKLGRLKGYPNSYSLDLFRQCTEDSLRRLRVDCLDLTQLHCVPTDYLRGGVVFDWLRQLREEGLIRFWGASVETMEEALICLEQDDITSLQIIFNIFRQKPIETIFDQALRKKVALIIRLPLASGLLSGKLNKDTTFSPQDHRSYNRDGQAFSVGETFAGIEFAKGVEIVDRLKPLVPSGMSMSQFALRWILDFDAVSVIIPGATKHQQVVSNVAASEIDPLPTELHQKLKEIYDKEIKAHIRGAY